MLKFKLAEPVAKKQEKEEIEVEVALEVDADGDVCILLNDEEYLCIMKDGRLLDVADWQMMDLLGLDCDEGHNLKLTT